MRPPELDFGFHEISIQFTTFLNLFAKQGERGADPVIVNLT